MFATTVHTKRIMSIGTCCLVSPKICASQNIIVKSIFVTFGLTTSRLTCVCVCVRVRTCF